MPAQPAILYNTFGTNDDFDTTGSNSATTPDRGVPPSDNDVAAGFEIPTGPNYTLESIELALSFRAGANELDVYLLGDRVPTPPNPAGIPHETQDPTDNTLIDGNITITTDGLTGFTVTTDQSGVGKSYLLDE